MALVIEDIKYFIVVSETQNITRASERLGLSQPALSYALKRLEQELGAELLIRLKNGIKLTKLGDEFLKRSRKIIFDWEELKKITDPQSQFIQTHYSFAIHPSVALYSLKGFMPQLSAQFPLLNLQFHHGLSRLMTEKVISWEADFGIVVNPVRHPDLVIAKLCTDDVTLFAKEGAPKRLIYDPELTQSEYIMKKIRKHGSFEASYTSQNLEVIAQLASLGQGLAILPTRVAAHYPELKAIEGAPLFKDEICLIYRSEKHKNSVSKKIIEFIKSAKI